MPPFVPIIFTLFFAVFIVLIIYSISHTANKLRKQNNEPIKKFTVDGKKYSLYAKQSFNRYYNNQVAYELRDHNGNVLGTFNSLNDVLVLLNIDKFPSEDIFE